MDVNTTLGQRIREVRTEANLTQAQFGEVLRVSQDTVSLWEKDKSAPAVETLVALCRAFHVSFSAAERGSLPFSSLFLRPAACRGAQNFYRFTSLSSRACPYRVF